jgi:hypothetical protein
MCAAQMPPLVAQKIELVKLLVQTDPMLSAALVLSTVAHVTTLAFLAILVVMLRCVTFRSGLHECIVRTLVMPARYKSSVVCPVPPGSRAPIVLSLAFDCGPRAMGQRAATWPDVRRARLQLKFCAWPSRLYGRKSEFTSNATLSEALNNLSRGGIVTVKS